MTMIAMMWMTVLWAHCTVAVEGGGGRFSIPGTTQTDSGYDTELGEDPICWRSSGSETGGGGGGSRGFPGVLVRNFTLNVDERVELLRCCPPGNRLTGTAPAESLLPGGRLRTGRWYDYSVNLRLDLTNATGNVQADDGPRVALQVLLCELGTVGFCSPFVHEEANARLFERGNFNDTGRGDRHGGTHVHSPYAFVGTPPEEGPVYEFEVAVPMLVNQPGSFFAIAAAHWFIVGAGDDENTQPALMRYDMANALTGEQRLINYQEPPEILEVPDSVFVISIVGIGVSAAIISFLCLQTWKHRDHQIMKLTQGRFLLVFLAAALTATCSAFLLDPRSDAWCRASMPLVMISVQIMYGVTIGRLWRINAVISPLLIQTLRRSETWNRKFIEQLRKVASCGLKRNGRRGSIRQLRMAVSSKELSRVVVLFTLPQVVLQILAVTLQTPWADIDWNSDESKGRRVCENGLSVGQSIVFYGFYLFALLFFVLLFMAQATRKLPSLFNETQDIFDSTKTSLIILVLGVGILFVTNGPTTSPAVQYLVGVALILSMTLNNSLRIMMPKLRMIWRGETVIVSKLITDHAKASLPGEYRTSLVSNANISGLSPPPTPPPNSAGNRTNATTDCSRASDSTQVQEELESFDPQMAQTLTFPQMNVTGETDSTENSDRDVTESSRLRRFAERRESARGITPAIHSKIVVKKEEAPPRRLVLRMVDMQERLAEVNARIMSGVAISEEEWIALREMSGKLGTTFRDDVQFSWEKSESLVGCGLFADGDIEANGASLSAELRDSGGSLKQQGPFEGIPEAENEQESRRNSAVPTDDLLQTLDAISSGKTTNLVDDSGRIRIEL